MVVGFQKNDQLVQLGLIGPDRVRAAVRFELKPAEIFSGGGLQIDCHVEAVCMLPYSYEVGALRVVGSGEPQEPRDDEFGFDAEFTARVQGVALWLYRNYWRVAVVGSEELHPVMFDLQPLARLFGLPIVPITPTFPWLGLAGLVPLPSKWFIAFGKPIDVSRFGPESANDARLVVELTEEIRSWIEGTLHKLLARRRTIFF